ncbi:MAG: acyltransferase family protein, partial [Actinomycetota bacterium]
IRTYFGSDTRADGLLFGCAAALIANPAFERSRDEQGRPQVPLAGFPVAALAAATILATFFFRDIAFRETFRYTIQSIAIVALLRYAIVAVGSPAFRALNAKPIAWFGQMSYGFYLVHQVVILGLEQRISSKVPIFVISLVLSTLVAWGLHLVVERPAHRLRNKTLAALRSSPRPATSASV